MIDHTVFTYDTGASRAAHTELLGHLAGDAERRLLLDDVLALTLDSDAHTDERIVGWLRQLYPAATDTAAVLAGHPADALALVRWCRRTWRRPVMERALLVTAALRGEEAV